MRCHAATPWAADFVSVKSLPLGGVVDLCLPVLVHVRSRKVIGSDTTVSSDTTGMPQQTRNATMQMGEASRETFN
jgi:hypothetical protein